MKPTITDIFDDCIEAIRRKETTVEECLRLHEDVRVELEPMLVVASRLLEAGNVVPDSIKKQQARDALLAAVEQKRWATGVEREALKTAPAKRRPRMLALGSRLGIITLIFLALMGSTLAMAKESLPGSPFYPLKLAVEHARIGLAGDDATKAKLYLNAADERMNELKKLKSEDPRYTGLVKAMATNIELAEKTSTDGSDKEFSVAVSSLVKKNREVLEDTLDKVPLSARPAIRRALTKPLKSGGALVEEPDDKSGDSNAGNASGGNSGYANSAGKHPAPMTPSASSSRQRSHDSNEDKNRTVDDKNKKLQGGGETATTTSLLLR